MNLKPVKSAPLLLCVLLAACITSNQPRVVSREVPVTHPSLNGGKPVQEKLFQTLDKQGNLQEYYLDVPSVICGDGRCEIIPVRLHWDALGGYLRYELPRGGNLTKRGHAQFSAADHEKLQSILLDPGSLLKDVNPKEVVSPVDAQTGDEIDGTSGATLLSDKESIVSGAVYTCYTLWHWVNSDVQETIRDISAREMDDEQLIRYLNSGNDEKAVFAMEQLTRRKVYDDATVSAVFEKTLKGGTELTDQGLEYFQSMGAAAYYDVVAKLFPQSSARKQVMMLTSLSSTKLEAPVGFYDRLSANLPNLGNYYEIHLLLNLMTDRNFGSKTVVENTLSLLDHKSFLVGRRAYYFLKEQRLTDAQRAKVDAFGQKYADRL